MRDNNDFVYKFHKSNIWSFCRSSQIGINCLERIKINEFVIKSGNLWKTQGKPEGKAGNISVLSSVITVTES